MRHPVRGGGVWRRSSTKNSAGYNMNVVTKAAITQRVPSQSAAQPTKRRRTVAQLEDTLVKSYLSSLGDHDILRLLFRLVSPCSDYDRWATACIKEFGGLRGLVTASPQELQRCGITERTALCIRLISEIPVRVLKERAAERPIYQSSQAIFDYLSYSMRGLKTEVFRVIHLNGRNQIIEALELFKGSVNNTPVCPREIVESAVQYRAVSMIFAHNHPSGDPTPSRNDRQLTRDLVFIGSVVQIRVLDHIIVGDNSHFSFADEGLIEKYEDSFLMLRIKAGA